MFGAADPMSRADIASSILKRYALASGGAGLVTAPFIGMAAITGLHLALMHDLSRLYGVEFSKDSARGILLALGAAFVPGWLGGTLERSLLKRLPAVTGAVGWVAMAGLSAAVTYGLGKVMIEHFEAGGTLKDVDMERLHQAWRHAFGARQQSPAA